jgi:imidazolonepropionase-like amidohydrolase
MTKILFPCLLLLISFIAEAQKTFIHCGTLIDGYSQQSYTNKTIIVEGNTITAIRDGYTSPGKEDNLIDLKDKTVMPGLMDMHVHLTQETSRDRYVDVFRMNPPDIAFEAQKYGQITLMAGFTTVRDLGGEIAVNLRNAISKGTVIGPRIFAAGKSIASTGGHADPTNGYRKDLMGDPGPQEGVVNGLEDARKAVRQRYKDGSDWIKITATGGVLSVATNGLNPQFTEEEIRAIVETARDYGFKVAAHAHGDEGMRRAIRAGVTSIEHGTMMEDSTMDLMIKMGTWYVPTITAGKSVADSGKIPGYYPAVVQKKAVTIGPRLQTTFGKAYKKGVKIAFGTDAGVFKHGMNAKEFAYMVEAGMPPMEAIQSATLKTAQLLGIEDKLGTIREGKLADIIAVKGNPLKDINAMLDVTFVMKDGKVCKNL